MNIYEIRKNTGWNANIRGLWVIVAYGWQAIDSTEDKTAAQKCCDMLNKINH